MKYILILMALLYMFGGHGPLALMGLRLLGIVLIITLAFKLPRIIGELARPTRHL